MAKQKWIVSSSDRGWEIIDVYSGRKKFIGPIAGSGINYHDRAIALATERNAKFGLTGTAYVPLLDSILNEQDQNIRRIRLMGSQYDTVSVH